MVPLTLSKTEGGNDIYLKIKTELLRIYSENPLDSYKKALTRQMTGLLSQLGYQIINDICTKTTKLDGCCCEAATMALWSMSLLVNIMAILVTCLSLRIVTRAYSKQQTRSICPPSRSPWPPCRPTLPSPTAIRTRRCRPSLPKTNHKWLPSAEVKGPTRVIREVEVNEEKG